VEFGVIEFGAVRDFAFIQTAPRRVFVGWGPFEQLPFRRPDRPAFYVTDFFLDDPHPWRHPAEWEEMSVEDFADGIAGDRAPCAVPGASEAGTGFRRAPGPSPAASRHPLPRGEGDEPDHEARSTKHEARPPVHDPIAWQSPAIDTFAALFDSAQAGFARGDFQKIVPVMFEQGRYDGDVAALVAPQLATLPQGLVAYGYSYHSHGMIGATPELLFRAERRGYATMALAGTRPVARAEELLRDAKELREHRFVVDDIVRRLAPFGNVEIGAIGIMRMPNIAHLITPIYFAENGAEKMSFSEMVRRLHPTAALGVSPRNGAGDRWLREADRGVKRRSFGAPFGLERPDHSALAVVAIRNVQWQGSAIRIGSGAGLLPESRVEREFEELRQKRNQVKALFGLDEPAAQAAASA
jgi:menaquinone-specific isochorismate synthase